MAIRGPLHDRKQWSFVHKRGLSLDDCLNANLEDIASDVVNGEQESEEEKTMSSSDVVSEEDSLQTRFGRLLSCEDMSDIHFMVKNGVQKQPLRVPAHRLVLAVSSPVFKDMFFGSESANEDIVVEDMEPMAFVEFLRFLYTDCVQLSKDNAISLLQTARKYHIVSLERACIHYVRTSIGADNCLVLWLTARALHEPEMEALALRVVERFARDVCLGKDFLRADFAAICELLSDDWLCIDEEILFRAVTRWAKSQCLRNARCPTRANIRHVLAEAIQLIRFPLMTREQIRTTVANEGVLEEDVLRMLMAIHRTWPRVAKEGVHHAFCNAPRAHQRLHSPLNTVQRFQSFDNQLPNNALNASLLVTTDRRIFVAGVGVYGPRRACSFRLQITVSIARADATQCPSVVDREEKVVRVKCDGTHPVLPVHFDRPFLVDAHIQHRVNASVTPTEEQTCVVRARLNPHLFYTSGQEIQFFYGTRAQFTAKTITSGGDVVVFNFLSTDSEEKNVVFGDVFERQTTTTSSSAPPTPNPPPPRPPPPREYRRPSRIARLRRALSFSDRREIRGIDEEVVDGQIPVLLFFA